MASIIASTFANLIEAKSFVKSLIQLGSHTKTLVLLVAKIALIRALPSYIFGRGRTITANRIAVSLVAVHAEVN